MFIHLVSTSLFPMPSQTFRLEVEEVKAWNDKASKQAKYSDWRRSINTDTDHSFLSLFSSPTTKVGHEQSRWRRMDEEGVGPTSIGLNLMLKTVVYTSVDRSTRGAGRLLSSALMMILASFEQRRGENCFYTLQLMAKDHRLFKLADKIESTSLHHQLSSLSLSLSV